MASGIVVLDDHDALVESAAAAIAARLEAVGESAAVCLTGGSTVQPVYRRLAAAPLRARIPVERIDWFFGDERFVPAGHDWSNAAQARGALLDPLGVPSARIHAVPTDGQDPHDAARRYQDDLVAFHGADRLDPDRPLFDLVLLGMGADGHTASLFPGEPAVDEGDRWVVGVDRAGQPPHVARVSLTLPALASTRAVLVMVSGREKRAALARILAGEDLPAGRIHSRGALTWLVDREAAPVELHSSKDPP